LTSVDLCDDAIGVGTDVGLARGLDPRDLKGEPAVAAIDDAAVAMAPDRQAQAVDAGVIGERGEFGLVEQRPDVGDRVKVRLGKIGQRDRGGHCGPLNSPHRCYGSGLLI
jgi:hypothetical protein